MLIVLSLAIAFTSCRDRANCISCTKIDQVQKQLAQDSVSLARLERRELLDVEKGFHYCDSMLQFLSPDIVADHFEALNITQGYLQQYQEVAPLIKEKMSFSQKQLNSLKNDILSHYISDSLGATYLETEAMIADTIHQQVLYFKDRLGAQKKDIATRKQSINKIK